jgi:L-alanine-DL-glutamate epimerase-like enolase superfamily enzyme
MTDSRTIAAADLVGVHVPFTLPYRWTFALQAGPCALLVRLRDAGGREGLGEIPLSFHPTIPGQAYEEMTRSLVDRLVVGRQPQPRRFLAEAEAFTGWHFFPHLRAPIASGVESALWDLLGRQRECHVTELLGGRVRDRMECMWFVFEDTPENMAREVERAAADGFRTFYVKWSADEETAFERAGAVRESLPPGGVLRIDPNESWTRASAARYLTRIRDWPLEFVEQPLPRFDLQGMADLRRRTGIAVSTDQGTRTVEEAMQGLLAGAMDVLGTSPSDAGGIQRALEVCAAARAAGLATWIHSNVELGVGEAAMITVACLAENCTYAAQTERNRVGWDVARGVTFDGPYLTLAWDEPGFGIELLPDRLDEAAQNYREGRGNVPMLDSDLPRRFIPAY